MPKDKIRFGYSFWGFLGDNKIEGGKEVSTPDGNATYSWSILWEAMFNRGWDVYCLQKDRDLEAFEKYGFSNFHAFSTSKRSSVYAGVSWEPEGFPELDVLLLEWRWPIEGRNFGIPLNDPRFQPDYMRQVTLLGHYKNTKTKIILWDLDHKLTLADESFWKPDAIFETSVKPLKLSMDRISVEPPIVIQDLMQFPTVPVDPSKKLVYIGSRYERDDVIQEWIAPISERFPGQVQFWGNWTNEPNLTECKQMWPNISYNGRITVKDFHRVYRDAVAVPLLAKKSYLETGFITPRPWEALLFGSMPIGLSSHLEVENYSPIVAEDWKHMADMVELYSGLTLSVRDSWRRDFVERLEFMDARHFVDKIEKVLG